MLNTATRQGMRNITILEKKGSFGFWTELELSYLYAFICKEYPNQKYRPKIVQPDSKSTTIAISSTIWEIGELFERLSYRFNHKGFLVLIEKISENPWVAQEKPFEW